eukprot:5195140-Pyramimonas_sp.AAC.1
MIALDDVFCHRWPPIRARHRVARDWAGERDAYDVEHHPGQVGPHSSAKGFGVPDHLLDDLLVGTDMP